MSAPLAAPGTKRKPTPDLILTWLKLAQDGFVYPEIARIFPAFSVHQIRHYCEIEGQAASASQAESVGQAPSGRSEEPPTQTSRKVAFWLQALVGNWIAVRVALAGDIGFWVGFPVLDLLISGGVILYLPVWVGVAVVMKKQMSLSDQEAFWIAHVIAIPLTVGIWQVLDVLPRGEVF